MVPTNLGSCIAKTKDFSSEMMRSRVNQVREQISRGIQKLNCQDSEEPELLLTRFISAALLVEISTTNDKNEARDKVPLTNFTCLLIRLVIYQYLKKKKF